MQLREKRRIPRSGLAGRIELEPVGSRRGRKCERQRDAAGGFPDPGGQFDAGGIVGQPLIPQIPWRLCRPRQEQTRFVPQGPLRVRASARSASAVSWRLPTPGVAQEASTHSSGRSASVRRLGRLKVSIPIKPWVPIARGSEMGPCQETVGIPSHARESALGRMARRERGACPQRPLTREQRRQMAQRALALRVAPLFRFSCVARSSQTTAVCSLLAPGRNKKLPATRRDWVFQQSPKS